MVRKLPVLCDGNWNRLYTQRFFQFSVHLYLFWIGMGFTFLFASEADLESRAVFWNCCRGPEKINCRNELWRCAREIQIFVKILGPTFELVLLTLTSDSSWFLDWFWLQGLHLINTKIEGPCCSHGRRLSTQPRSVWFQLSENWLILVAGGCQR